MQTVEGDFVVLTVPAEALDTWHRSLEGVPPARLRLDQLPRWPADQYPRPRTASVLVKMPPERNDAETNACVAAMVAAGPGPGW